jgi:hypothetical protein
MWKVGVVGFLCYVDGNLKLLVDVSIDVLE